MPNELEERAAWFTRNADPSNPKAFINTDPRYFASECSAAIMNGSLAFTQESGWMPSPDDAELVELLTDWRDYFAPDGKRIRLADGNKERLHMILRRVIERLSPDPHSLDRAGMMQEVDDA